MRSSDAVCRGRDEDGISEGMHVIGASYTCFLNMPRHVHVTLMLAQ